MEATNTETTPTETTAAPIYLTPAEIAKRIRADLKVAFPGVKFSVTSRSFAGGSSVSTGWTDGPTVDAVDAVINRWNGVSFDGMQDLKSYHDVEVDGVRYHCGSWINSSRSYSNFEARKAIAAEMIRSRCAIDERGRFGNYDLDTLAGALVRACGDDISVEVAFRRAILNDRDAAEPCGDFVASAEDALVEFRDYHRCETCRQERRWHVRTQPKKTEETETMADSKKKTGAARASEGRCPDCGRPRLKKDLVCLGCPAKKPEPTESTEPAAHKCRVDGCDVLIPNRYKFDRCTHHSMEPARAERERLAAAAAATSEQRKQAGSKLAASNAEKAAAGDLRFYLDGTPVRGHERLYVIAETEKGTDPALIREAVEQKRTERAASAPKKSKARKAEAEAATASTDTETTNNDETQPTTNEENTMKTTAKKTAKATKTAKTTTNRAGSKQTTAKKERATTAKKSERATRGAELLGAPATAVIRSLSGKMSFDEVVAALKKRGIELSAGSIRNHLRPGASKKYGPGAKLTSADIDALKKDGGAK